MAKAATKAPRKKAAKKSKKKGAPSSAGLEAHQRERKHVAGKLDVAHRAVLSILSTVKASDAAGISKLRRAVEHAHDNATGGR